MENVLEAASWHYLAEGNANIVFATTLAQPHQGTTGPISHLALRVRKSERHATAADQFSFRQDVLLPFMQQHQITLPCLPQELVNLTPALRRRLGACLATATAQRPAKFQDSSIDLDDAHALVMPWLRDSIEHTQILRPVETLVLEFKPKWLTWSPTAPRTARYCRTCAVRAHRDKPVQLPNPSRYCPLVLVAGHDAEDDVLATTVDGLFRQQGWSSDKLEVQDLCQFFAKTPHFVSLAKLQAAAASFDLPLAMTLRDCSCFLVVRDGLVVECWFADLDLKSADKTEHWQTIEDELEAHLWYTDAEIPDRYACRKPS